MKDIGLEVPDLPAELRERLDEADRLLASIKEQLPNLTQMLHDIEDHWGIEDGVYRFYHQSFKVYALQAVTEDIVKALRALLPNRRLNEWFSAIVAAGTGHEFDHSHNQDWLNHTRPILEALFHAHYFLKMVVKYGTELESAPQCLPSGWAAVLYLFDLR